LKLPVPLLDDLDRSRSRPGPHLPHERHPVSIPNRSARPANHQFRPSWTIRQRNRASSQVMGLALTAVAIEAASMLPYLAGFGIITTQGPGWPGSVLLLVGYCIVMIAPALVLLTLRL